MATTFDLDDRLVMHDQINRALQERKSKEARWQALDNQFWTRDRPHRASSPWAGASNIRWPVAKLLVKESMPDLAFLPFSSHHVATFQTLKREVKDFIPMVEAYFDCLLKNKRSGFTKQYFYYLFQRQHYGTGYVKVTWDAELELPIFQHVHPLLVITPTNAKSLEDSPWMVEVIQLWEHEFLEQYGDTKENRDFLEQLNTTVAQRSKKVKEGEPRGNAQHDSAAREQAEYDRIGISRSDTGKVVLHIRHFVKEGVRQWMTLSPDVTDHDFKDVTEYPTFDDGEPVYGQHYMILNGPRQYMEEKLDSSEGITGEVEEFEHSASKVWQAQQNYIAITGNPIFAPKAGAELPSTTQNMQMRPGSFLPIPSEVVTFPNPPFSWSEQKAELLQAAERVSGEFSPSRSLAKQPGGSDNVTATQVRREGFSEDKRTQFDAQIVTLFLEDLFNVSWRLTVYGKPKSMDFVLGSEISQLPPNALTNSYFLKVKGTVDQVNKEFRIQRWLATIDTALKLGPIMTPQAMLNMWKGFVHEMHPGSGEEFLPDLTGAGQSEEKAAMLDVFTIMMGGDIQPQPHEDHKVRAEAGTKVLLTADDVNMSLTQPAIQGINQYIAAHREMLKRQNPAQFQQFMETINMIDIQRTRQAAAEELERGNAEAEMAMAGGGRGLPPQVPPTNGNGAVPPQQGLGL